MIYDVVQRWRDERLGLLMILSSVLVISAIIFLLFSFQQQERITQLRSQGASLSRALVDIPFQQLSSRRDAYGPLTVLRTSQVPNEFAYGVVTAPNGDILNAVTSPGIHISDVLMPESPSSWPGERRVVLPEKNNQVLEFFAPILDGGNLVGNVRIGYLLPNLGLAWSELPFLATIALTIFLLTPIFYFLVRREIRPIHAANSEMADVISDGQLRAVNIEASGELREFIGKFNQFVGLAQTRIENLETKNNDLLTSRKLLSYRQIRTESVLQAIPEAVIILGEDGRVSFANEKIQDLLGVGPAEIIKKSPTSWCTNPELLDTLISSGAGGKYFYDTIRVDSPASPRKKLAIKAYPLFAPEDPDTIFGRLVILRDATKDALAEESRANFVAHVAHELKTPLNSIALYAEALRGEQSHDESFRIEAHNVISDEIGRLATLVDNLLNITKIEMGSLKVEKQRVRLLDLLNDAFQHMQHIGRGSELNFELDLPLELNPVTVDKQLLRVAINNLMSNAIKYSDPGGTVRLTALETDDSIQISVVDSGIGISPDDQKKIFDKFYRSSDEKVRDRSGHGLGLPLAREIVELHRGQLSVKSRPGEGTEFVIDLWKDSGLLQEAI